MLIPSDQILLFAQPRQRIGYWFLVSSDTACLLRLGMRGFDDPAYHTSILLDCHQNKQKQGSSRDAGRNSAVDHSGHTHRQQLNSSLCRPVIPEHVLHRLKHERALGIEPGHFVLTCESCLSFIYVTCF